MIKIKQIEKRRHDDFVRGYTSKRGAAAFAAILLLIGFSDSIATILEGLL